MLNLMHLRRDEPQTEPRAPGVGRRGDPLPLRWRRGLWIRRLKGLEGRARLQHFGRL